MCSCFFNIEFRNWCDETILRKENEKFGIENEIEIGVQVNGKLRGSIEVDNNTSEDDMVKLAMENENVLRHIEGKEIIKTIVIKKRIVNIVVK